MTVRINSPLMGEVDVEEKDLLFFPRGLPGFEKLHRWVLAGEDDDPIKWLVSADLGQIALPVADPALVDSGYSPSIPSEVLEELEINRIEDALSVVILNIPRQEPWKGTANLLAPLVIDPKSRRGRQVVLSDERYSVYTSLVSEEESARIEAEEAGTTEEEGNN